MGRKKTGQKENGHRNGLTEKWTKMDREMDRQENGQLERQTLEK